MRRILKNILKTLCIVLGVIVLSPNMYVEAETAYEAPQTPIAITDFKMSTRDAKPGDTIQYSFTINDVEIKDFLHKYGELLYDCYPDEEDEYSGVYDVTLYWKSSNKQLISCTYSWEWEDGWNTETLKISGKIPVKKGMQKGEWHLENIFISVGTTGFYVVDNRFSTNEQHPSSPDPLMDLSVADFTISGTGKVDHKAPTITLKSLKIKKRYLKDNERGSFSVKVKDQSGIEKVESVWALYTEDSKSKWTVSNRVCKMTYNKKTKKYQCSVKVGYAFTKAILTDICVTDIYGNKKWYSAYSNQEEYVPRKKERKYYNAYKKMYMVVR